MKVPAPFAGSFVMNPLLEIALSNVAPAALSIVESLSVVMVASSAFVNVPASLSMLARIA